MGTAGLVGLAGRVADGRRDRSGTAAGWALAAREPGLAVKRRSVGFVLVAEAFGDALTPVTFYRAKR